LNDRFPELQPNILRDPFYVCAREDLPDSVRLAADHAQQDRAAAAAKTWLLAQIGKKRPALPTDPMETAPDQPFDPERLAA
jgi:hypothetical protein